MTGPAIPGRVMVLSDTALTVVERSKPRQVALPSDLRLPTLSPAGTHLAGVVGTQLVLIDTKKANPTAAPLTDAPQTALIAWAPGGDRLALADSGRITIVDTKGKRGPVIEGFTGDIRSVHWSPDEQHLAVEVGPLSATDRTVWIAAVAGGPPRIAAKNATVLAWAPDSRSLVAALYTDRGDNRVLALPLEGESKVLVSSESLAAARPELADMVAKNYLQAHWAGWSPKGDVLAVTFKAAGPDPRFVALTLSPQGQLLAAWVPPVFPQPFMTPPLPCSVGRMMWALNQERLVAPMGNPGCDKTVALLHAQTLEKVGELTYQPLSGALVSPDGAWVALRNQDGKQLDIIHLSDSSRKVSLPVTGELLLWANR